MDSSSSPGSRIVRVDIANVRVGMFIGDVFDRNGALLLSANVSLSSTKQIQQLTSRGVTSVLVDAALSRDPDTVLAHVSDSAPPPTAEPRHFPPEREHAYYTELEKARGIHEQTIVTARRALQAIRSGKEFRPADVRDSSESMVESILRNPDALVSLTQIKGYDEYTYTHSVNVGILVTSLAHEMGYNPEQLIQIGMGGILHDIGKMRVPENILNKPGKLTAAEFAIVKRHPEHGQALVADKKGISDLSRAVIIQHHERFNGKGYPAGLAREEIHEVGLISAVADVYDALTSDRVYKEAWTPQRALALIFQGCDEDYSRTIVERFTRHLGIYPVGSFVRLASGEKGVVVRVDKGKLLYPVVLVLFGADGHRLTTPCEMDLGAHHADTLFCESPRIEVSLNPREFGIVIGDYIGAKAAA